MKALVAAVLLCLVACEGRARTSTTGRATALLGAPHATATSDIGVARVAPARTVRILQADPDADVTSLVRTRRLEAKAAGRTLVVYVGAGWCEPCRRFQAAIEAGKASGRLADVDLLAFDADRDGDRVTAAGYAPTSIPYVALAGPDGAPLETAAAGKGSHAHEAVLDRLESWARPR